MLIRNLFKNIIYTIPICIKNNIKFLQFKIYNMKYYNTVYMKLILLPIYFQFYLGNQNSFSLQFSFLKNINGY